MAEKERNGVRHHHRFNQLPEHGEQWVLATTAAAVNVESCGGEEWANWGKTG